MNPSVIAIVYLYVLKISILDDKDDTLYEKLQAQILKNVQVLYYYFINYICNHVLLLCQSTKFSTYQCCFKNFLKYSVLLFIDKCDKHPCPL